MAIKPLKTEIKLNYLKQMHSLSGISAQALHYTVDIVSEDMISLG